MIYGDSNLVVQLTMKACDALADNMIAYSDLYNIMEGIFDVCELRNIGRQSNEEVDILANIDSNKPQVPPGVFLERIEHRSIKPKLLPLASTAAAKDKTASTQDPPVKVLLVEPTWTQPFLA